MPCYSLTSLGSLEHMFPFLRGFFEGAVVKGFVEGTLPSFLLVGLMSVLPYILAFVGYCAGLVSEAEITSFVVKWYFLFLMFHVFLVSVVSGSLITSFQCEKPSAISPAICLASAAFWWA